MLPLSVSSYLVVGRHFTRMSYRQVSVNWPKSISVKTWTSSCLAPYGSACRQARATKLGMRMARGLGQVLLLSASSYLVVGRRVTPISYRQVSVNWPKSIAVKTWTSSCLAYSGSACRQARATKLGIDMARGLG